MISADLRFEGFDAHSWRNLISLFAPEVIQRLKSEAATTDAPELSRTALRSRPDGAVVIIVSDRGHVLKAFHTRRGRIRDIAYDNQTSLEAICSTYSAKRCVVLREGVVEEINERIARRMHRDHDYMAQLLVIARCVREMRDTGLLTTWPNTFSKNVPVPTMGMIDRAINSVLPDNQAFVLTIWKADRLWTALVLHRQNGQIVRIAGPEQILQWTGPLGGDWRRDHHVISKAVSRAVAPVHLGIYAQRDTLRPLLRSYDPGAWAAAVTVREIIVKPAPPYVTVALAADTLRAVAKHSAELLGGFETVGHLTPVATYLRGWVSNVASVNATLGFDPLKALSIWLKRSDALDGSSDE